MTAIVSIETAREYLEGLKVGEPAAYEELVVGLQIALDQLSHPNSPELIPTTPNEFLVQAFGEMEEEDGMRIWDQIQKENADFEKEFGYPSHEAPPVE